MYALQHASMDHPCFIAYAQKVVEQQLFVDRRKTLQFLLPVVHTDEEVRFLLRIFNVDRPVDQINYLIRVDTPMSYYVIFQNMRQMDHETAQLSEYCNMLLAKNTDMAYNLVSIIKHYFDLPQVRGQFSLRLSDYELSRLESSFATFRSILCRI